MTIRIGPFEFQDRVGHGAMGEVWRAVHEPTGRPVAVKVADELAGAPDSKQREFREEVRAQAALGHPGVARIHEYGRVRADDRLGSPARFDPGTPYLAMEYAPGGTLYERPPRREWRRVRSILFDVLDTLAYVHARDVVHRDLKPSNMLWAPESSGPDRPKLADFGLAYLAERRVAEAGTELVSPTAGTPRFMAPEQFRGDWRLFGPWTDLYQLGAIAWTWVCDRPPFEADKWLETANAHLEEQLPPLRPEFDVPEGLDAWLSKLLAKRPSGRFRRAADAASALAELDDGLGGLDDEQRRPVALLGPALAEEGRGSDEALSPADSGDYDLLVGAGRGLFGLREIPFVDRDPERRTLWETVLEVRESGRPRIALIEGESGTGKSRLARWIARRAHETGLASVLRAVHTSQGSPGEGLRGLVEDAFETWGLGERAARELILDRLRIAAPEIDEQTLRDDAEGLASLAVGPGDSGPPEGPGVDRDLQQYVVLERLIAHLGARRDVLVLLDDIQWGGTTMSCLESFLERRPDLPVTFVLTARSGALEGATGNRLARVRAQLAEDQFAHLELEALSREDHSAIVRQLLPMEPRLVGEIAAHTEGNPLAAFQLVGDWLERGRFERSDAGFRLRGGIGEGEMPDAIHEVWQRRLDAAVDSLEESDRVPARTALELAAALGRRVDAREWRRACLERDVAASLRLVEVLVELGLAESRPDGWSFAHAMIAESVARAARETGRWRDHKRAAAEALESLYADRPEATGRRRAEYWIAAGRGERALGPLTEAIDGAVAHAGNDEIEELLDRRLEVIEQLEVPEEGRPRVQNWIRRASVERRRGRPERATELLERAVRVARREDWSRELAEALLERAFLFGTRGEVERAIRGIERAESWFESLGEPLRVAECLGRRVPFVCAAGRPEEAEAMVDRAEAIFAEAGHELYGQLIKNTRAYVYLWTGRLAEVRELGRRQLDWGRRRDNSVIEALGTHVVAEICRFEGELERAERLYDRAREMHRRLGRRQNAHRSQLGLAWVSLQRRDGRGAERLVEPIERQSAWGEFGRELAEARLVRAGCCAIETDAAGWDEALNRLRSDGRAALLGGYPFARNWELLGALADESGLDEAAADAWREARVKLEASDDAEAFRRLDEKLEERHSTP